jgi:hypothetical protein
MTNVVLGRSRVGSGFEIGYGPGLCIRGVESKPI